MQKIIYPAIAILLLVAVPLASATNGDNLIGVGPVSRAMGGVGVASPQDSITAIFVNPAGMGFCPCGEESEAIFGGILFDPTVKSKITTPMGTLRGESQHRSFVIPSVGVTMPLNDQWRFGIGAFGISGLGVDYRNNGFDLDGDPSNGFEGDAYTRLEIMKFAPMLSYQVAENFSVGAALQLAYNNLDLGQGGTHDYSFGAQIGLLYAIGMFQFGASYTTPEKATHDRVFNFDSFTGDQSLDTLELEAPASYVVGAAIQPNQRWMAEVDLKYYQWSDAAGYEDFDWDNQLVIAVGTQYMANDKLALRAGFNYGESPVNEHAGWNPNGITEIQGKQVPTFGYELFRTIGFPAVVESHLTLGAGYQLTESMSLNVSYMHAFENTITNPSAGEGVILESSLEEDSVGFSLSWAFE